MNMSYYKLNVDCWSYHTAAASLLLQRAFALLKTSKSPPRIIADVHFKLTRVRARA
jgi:hypothetical protein